MLGMRRLALAILPAASLSIGVLFGGLSGVTYANAAMTQSPTLNSPSSASTLSTFGPTLQWTLPRGSTQYQLQVVPSGNDGPGVNIIANAASVFAIPAPPDWYGLLPDMTYSWRVRATDATSAVGDGDSTWGPWSTDFTFRTPAPSDGAATPFSPSSGATVSNLTPVLSWSSSTDNLFYWEVQVSKDSQFQSNAFLYWELRHGGVTTPANSYTIPSAYPLEAGTTYYWHVRPRVQGDGASAAWGATSSFNTPSNGSLLLNVTSPADHSTVTTSSVTVRGTTKAGALVTVNDSFSMAGADGRFAISVGLVEGINNLEIYAIDMGNGDNQTVSLVVTYAR